MRRTMMLKPMQPGVSGYARLQCEGGRTLVQLHARGLEAGTVHMYWYLSGQRARELGQRTVNAHGEASLEAETPMDASGPERLQALMLITGGEHPKPLLVGLCAQQSAGSLMDVKNAALALCDRLSRPAQKSAEPAAVLPAPAAVPAEPKKLPREIFLPAIDPAPYAAALQPPPALPKPARSAPPAGRLKPLVWPRGFEKLRPYFEQALPCALFDLPGWRFVYAAHAGGPGGLWLGIFRQDGRVVRVAYAHRGQALGPNAKPVRGLDGMVYQVLWQNV